MSFESSANGINFNVKETTTLISEEIIEYLDELENVNIVPIDKLNVLNAQQLAFMFSALPTLSKMKLSNTQLSKIINSLFGNASNNIRKRLSEPNNLKKEEYNKVIEFMNDWIKRIVDREGQLKEEKLS